MRIHVVGGGPAALYTALLARRRDPRHEVVVAERDGPDDTFGWGIVFSDRTLEFLREHDEATYAGITRASRRWDHVIVVHRGETVAVRGNGFSGIARLALLDVLRRRCRDLGVELRFRAPVTAPDAWLDCDLLVGADGAHSAVRRTWSEAFQPSVDLRKNRYVWLGTAQPFDGLVMIFREADAGLFIAHAYRFSDALSTFIVECPPDTWARSGLEAMTPGQALAYLGRVFAGDLGGHSLLTRDPDALRWQNFPLVRAKRWHHRHVVLVGDAAHTAHFSIGSGTKLALEDAIALDRALGEHGTVAAALPAYERARKPVVDAFQDAALRSLLWLEDVEAHLGLEPVPFTYRHMMRSRRVGYARLRARDPEFAARYDAWRGAQPVRGPIPAEFLDLFEKPTFAHLATLMPDGSPQVTPVWIDYDGRHLLVNSAAGRQKDLNMERRRRVAIEIPDPEDPNRYVAVRGTVVEITEEGADAHLDRLARRYLRRDRYPDSYRFPGEVRRIYRIEPERVTPWDPWG